MRRVVAVIGMGRSGTSLCCQALERLGVYFGEPDELIGKLPINPRGQYEHIPIQAIHRSLLENVFGVTTWLFLGELEAGWEKTETVRPYKESLKSIVAEGVRRARERDAVFGFKDARTTRLLPLWRDIFQELDLEPMWVLVVRPWRDVYDSLVRCGTVLGMPATKTRKDDVRAIWEQYMSDASTVEPHVVISFDDWFHETDQVMAKLATVLEKDKSSYSALVLVDEEMRHF